MSDHTALVALARQRLYPNYEPAPIAFVRGLGCELFDTDGRRWLDLCGGAAACVLGHGHPVLARAIAEQAKRLLHVSNHFYNEPNVRLADELCRRTGYDRVFFCNSGAEANEAMLKLARRHYFGRDHRVRQRVVAFEGAFHGRTLGALSLTGTPRYREGFGPLGAVTHVPYGDAEAVSRVMGLDVCAIVVEPLQGEAGVLSPPRAFLAQLRALADAYGALLLVDEVQTGVGRLGRFLASQEGGVRADAVALAKGLAGGVPIGAMLTTEALQDALPPGLHGSTFGGNAMAAAASLAVLHVIDQEGLMDGAREKGKTLGGLLDTLVHDLPEVCEATRGAGLLHGLVLRPGLVAREVLRRVVQGGLLLSAAGERVLRFSPPLVVSVAELEEGVLSLRDVLRTYSRRSDGPEDSA